MKIIISFIFLLICTFSIGQKRIIHFQIDTIVYLEELNSHSDFSVNVFINGEKHLYMGYDTKESISFSTYPNYTKKILIDNDSSTLRVPIFGNGGSIEIVDVYNLNSDTLRINKIEIIKKASVDSIHTSLGYYKLKYGKRIEKPYKTKNSSYSINNKKGAKPKDVLITVNNVSHLISINLDEYSHISGITNGDSYRPRRFMKRNGSYKKNVTHISYHRLSCKHHWIGKLRIKEYEYR